MTAAGDRFAGGGVDAWVSVHYVQHRQNMDQNNAIDRFVESWGVMGSVWGVNTSVARVHALLIASKRAHTLDEIVERLGISKSNASTSLKELRGWGVVRKVLEPGDRKDRYTAEPDVWKMLFSILRERKRREFDPARAAVDAALSSPEGGAELATGRLEEMKRLVDALDAIAERVLADESQARQMLAFFGPAPG